MNRVKQLEEKLTYHRDLYYNNNPEISDDEYDAIESSLKKINPDNKLFCEVGESAWEGFDKAKHIMNMHSLDKVSSADEFTKWFNKYSFNKVIVQHKLDGLSIELQYKDGNLYSAITRGDGSVGDNITSNVLKMNGAVKFIENFNGAVRGEIVLYKSVFNKLYKDEGYKNPRNMANGIAKQKKGEGCGNLTIISYDAVDNDKQFITETEKFLFIKNSGFIVSESKEFYNVSDIFTYRDEVEKTRDSLEYDIDGLVAKNDLIDLKDQERSKPTKQMAFKWKGDSSETVLLDVVWNRNGHTYTPVAQFESVELMGTTVKQASLVNFDEINRLDIKIGDTILVSKRGEIIPKVESKIVDGENRIDIVSPAACVICNNQLTITNKRVFCNNDFCDGRIYHRLQKWTNKLEVKGFGDALIEYLIGQGFEKISDLYNKEKVEEAIKNTNLKKATEKAFNNLYKIKELSLSKFIAGYDIEGIGEGVVDFIVKSGFDTFDKLTNITKNELLLIEGFSEVRADILLSSLPTYIEDMSKTTAYLIITGKQEKSSNLDGKSFCFTGALSIKRNDAEKLVKENSGCIKSIGPGLDYLVCNDKESSSSKMKKAIELNIKVINEEDFMSMIRE